MFFFAFNILAVGKLTEILFQIAEYSPVLQCASSHSDVEPCHQQLLLWFLRQPVWLWTFLKKWALEVALPNIENYINRDMNRPACSQVHILFVSLGVLLSRVESDAQPSKPWLKRSWLERPGSGNTSANVYVRMYLWLSMRIPSTWIIMRTHIYIYNHIYIICNYIYIL